jgi:hypothetical protein
MGTMSDVDRKSLRNWGIVLGVLTFIVALLTYTPLFDTYLFAWFQKQSSWTKYLGILSFLISIWSIFKFTDYTWGERGAALHGIIWLGFLALGIGLAAGFNFDLHGISPR